MWRRWLVSYFLQISMLIKLGLAFTNDLHTLNLASRCISSQPSSTLNSLPSIIVFDLDNTLWTPELYQLRKLQRSNQYPVAHKDVKLYPAVKSIIEQIRNEQYSDVKFAIASRTKSVDWANDLLNQFDIRELFDHIEIFPGDKLQHFSNIKHASGIDYKDMLFFDDNRDGKYGNCEPVSHLGVLSVHCPNGIYEESTWTNALEHYKEWSTHKTPGTIVEWDNTITTIKPSPNQIFKGKVKYINQEKRFGFIQHGGRGTKDAFFHFSALPNGQEVSEGDELSFTITTNTQNGKQSASNIKILMSNAGADADDGNTVNMRTFSMNLPFAALLANGYKTLETRNGTMFTTYPAGTKMLLHVGQRTYPDGNRHIDVMKSGGLDDDEIQALKSLPPGFTKGQAVAIVELGNTYETSLEQRCNPEFQRSVAAFGADSGMRATEIRRVEYLKKGVKVGGQGGVFKAKVSRDVIPEGWLEDDTDDGSVSKAKGSGKKKVFYSATF